ncbi:MAG: NAD-glutamate dehydrogenase [Actinomycetota bacterium]|nr:NAD-glutamate dehydrogenase [Actinomycetota bacterium]
MRCALSGSADADHVASERLLARAVDAAAAGPDDPASRPERSEYLAAYYRHVALEDLLGRSPEEVAGAAFSQREFAQQRVEGEVRIRIYTPTVQTHGWESPHTLVEIVTDDMPFLVDSAVAELTRQDIGVHLVVHPQFVVQREVLGRLTSVLGKADPEHPPPGSMVESWMHLEIDRQQDDRSLDRIVNDLRRVLTDVREAVHDWPRMRDTALSLAREMHPSAVRLPAEEVSEAADLLRWLADDHFTFLGYREYALVGDEGHEVIKAVPGTGLGILRSDSQSRQAINDMPAATRDKALEPSALIVTKANSRSTVHRPVYLDYIGVRRIDSHGRVIGERRFLGLFASAAYLDSVRKLPMVRRKVAEVEARSGFSPRSHSGKDLLSILETYPRDELFQISSDELYDIVMGVLALQQRRELRLFMRRDDYGRFWSCLVYLPRDRWNTVVRLRMEEILLSELGGTSIDYTTRVSESVLARLHFVVRTPQGEAGPIDVEAIQQKLADATRTWDEGLYDALVDRVGEEHTPALMRRYANAFPEAYKEDFPAAAAVADLRRLEMLEEPDDIGMSLYAPPHVGPGERRFKIYRVGAQLSLSDVLPLFQAHGLRVVDERPYGLVRDDGTDAWIYDFGLEPVASHPAVDQVSENFHNAFAAAWRGESEVDGFNALVLSAGLTWQQTVVLRAYAKYLRQVGTLYSQDYIQQAVRSNVEIARSLVTLFMVRFDPGFPTDDRAERQAEIVADIERALDQVVSLDQDRILRSLLALVCATTRTSYYQRGPDGRPKPYLALKFDPRAVPDIPLPRPRYEIFVYGPRVEGVHLRFGPVARGGLRWSDRPEDFRTEVLGLVKAQMVKNTVIVPVGAKGGFVVKRPPAGGDRESILAEGVACYRMFVSALLDVTDNLVGGRVVPPRDVVRHDADDSYLVVAADKGTATFSDIANSISASYGFWLGDAFASGGSVGYDHKAMGITARGAWESVKYHFREIGHDTQTEDFTVVGIGDMSGDVFGNGMLLSEHIRLVAAFDHRHIFLDPDPDAKISYDERRRLFELPRSSWADYDPTLISAGGGVYPRTAKSVKLTEEVRRALGIDASVEALAPADLIRRILAAPVDLLWNGGIGTYVKATAESQTDVGDKANDAVRVNGAQLRAKVVGEGGNLGLTQRGRVEYSLAGGRINTDAIDNSAGVDTSDREVNIKILLDAAVEGGGAGSTKDRRNALLGEMTDEVAGLVLRDNYDQNVALGNSRAQAHAMLSVHERLLGNLEQRGLLDRALEFLPDSEVLAERHAAGLGLTSPELAVVMAYVKIVLEDEITQTDLPDDPWLVASMHAYFPTPLRERYADRMVAHPLRREIITTQLVNDMVNRGGTTYVFRAAEETGVSPVDLTRAYLVTREVFGLGALWSAVEALDGEVSTQTQTKLYLQIRRLLDRATRWLLQNRRHPLDIGAEIARFGPGVQRLMPRIPDLLVAGEADRLRAAAAEYVGEGVPEPLALMVAGLLDAFSLLDIVEVAVGRTAPLDEVGRLYFVLSEHFHMDDLLDRIAQLDRGDRWHSLARSALRYDLYAALSEFTAEVLDTTSAGDAQGRIAEWERANASSLARVQNSLGELADETTYDLATLSVVLRQIRTMVRASASSAR